MAATSTAKKAKKQAKNKADKKPVSLELMHPEMADVGINKHFKTWLTRMRTLGLHQRQIVWELHVKQGHSIIKTAQLMGLSRQRVSVLFKELQEAVAENAPKSPEDYEFRRQQMESRLYAVIEDASKFPFDSRMLAVRLKAIDQLCELRGLKMQANVVTGSDVSVLDTPEGIAQAVQERMLAVHGRSKDILEAQEAMKMRDVGPQITSS